MTDLHRWPGSTLTDAELIAKTRARFAAERDRAADPLRDPLYGMTDAELDRVTEIALTVQARGADKRLPPSHRIVKSPPMPANEMYATPAKPREWFSVEEIVAWLDGPACLPASTVPGMQGRLTRWFALDDRHRVRAHFHQRVVGRSVGYDGWDATVSVYRSPEFHVRGVPDRRYLPDGGDEVIVLNTDGVCPTVAQIVDAARVFSLDDPPPVDVRDVRDRLGLTQQQLADALNAEAPGLAVNQPQIARWERGEQSPHPATMELMRRLIG